MYVCWQVVKAVERYVIYDSLRYYKEVRMRRDELKRLERREDVKPENRDRQKRKK